MIVLARLVIVLVVCLMVMVLPAPPAQAQCGGPYITLSPDSGAPGTEIAVVGRGFDAGKYVNIYYYDTRVARNKTDSIGYFTIFFTVPEGCSGAYQVQAVVASYTADAYFTVTPGLTVSPTEGPVGTNVTVKGQGFAKREESIKLIYYLDVDYQTIKGNITATNMGSWETNFLIPSSTRGEHRIDAQGAESKLYEVEDATFEVTTEITVDNSWGSMGDSITMTGSRFLPYEEDIQILFGGQPRVTGIKADARGNWEASFQVPEMPGGTYNVAAQGEWTKEEDIMALSFEIKPDIALLPDEGYVGLNLTVTGHGFAANEDVDIMYDGGTVETAKTNDQGSFDTSFPAPDSQHGEHQVAAGYAGQNHASAIFTMESQPPSTPTLTSPSRGGRVGLIGKAMPRFEWAAASDDSGVHYRLQIAASANVTTVGFVDPRVSITGLAQASYTLNTTEALPSGTYYWIVQAVDGAQNESPWTEPRPFRIGLLPLWAFIVAIVAIVMLFVVLIRSLVRRRTYYYE